MSSFLNSIWNVIFSHISKVVLTISSPLWGKTVFATASPTIIRLWSGVAGSLPVFVLGQLTGSKPAAILMISLFLIRNSSKCSRLSASAAPMWGNDAFVRFFIENYKKWTQKSVQTFKTWSVSCECLQVRADPARDGDSEESWEFVQRADRAADLHVQEQVNTIDRTRTSRRHTRLLLTSCFLFCGSWLKVTEHLTDRNMPVFQPGTKVRTLLTFTPTTNRKCSY